jgi:hypothetical protein
MYTKRTGLIFSLAVILVLAGTIGYQQFKAQDALAASKSMVGSWFVTVTPDEGAPFIDGAVFSSDGTAVVMENAGVIGLGVWEKLPNSRYAFSFWETYLEDGALINAKVSSTVELSADKEQYSGLYNFQVYADGNLVAEGSGTSTGVRQHLELTSSQNK